MVDFPHHMNPRFVAMSIAGVSFSLVMWLSVIPQIACFFLAYQIKEPKVFTADHPFIFIIQQKDTGNILFMGRVSNPTTL